jgi:hypothetical protein
LKSRIVRGAARSWGSAPLSPPLRVSPGAGPLGGSAAPGDEESEEGAAVKGVGALSVAP